MPHLRFHRSFRAMRWSFFCWLCVHQGEQKSAWALQACPYHCFHKTSPLEQLPCSVHVLLQRIHNFCLPQNLHMVIGYKEYHINSCFSLNHHCRYTVEFKTSSGLLQVHQSTFKPLLPPVWRHTVHAPASHKAALIHFQPLKPSVFSVEAVQRHQLKYHRNTQTWGDTRLLDVSDWWTSLLKGEPALGNKVTAAFPLSTLQCSPHQANPPFWLFSTHHPQRLMWSMSRSGKTGGWVLIARRRAQRHLGTDHGVWRLVFPLRQHFPGAAWAIPQTWDEQDISSSPFPGNLDTWGKLRQRAGKDSQTPSHMFPPTNKGHPWLPQPPPRRAPRFALRLCFSVRFVLPTYGPGWKSNHAGGPRNLQGGDKVIITGNVSHPRPAQHWFSTEKVYSACR